MNWLKENPFLGGLAALTIVGAGALGFFLTQAITHYSETTDAYTQAVQKLHTLQNRSPFPNEENLNKTKALVDEYKSALTGLHTQLVKMEVPLNPDIKPQQFQDNLRTAVNQTIEKASVAGVLLPKDFYLGFDQYANSLPTEKAAPALSRQLEVVNQIVENLISVKVQSIDGLERRLLPEESPSRQANPPGEGSQRRERSHEVLQRYPFNLSFTAEQGKFRVAFNALLGAKPFLIVRALSAQNTSPAGPPVAQSEKSGQAPGRQPGASSQPANLNVILGREAVKADLRIEILDFSDPEGSKK